MCCVRSCAALFQYAAAAVRAAKACGAASIQLHEEMQKAGRVAGESRDDAIKKP